MYHKLNKSSIVSLVFFTTLLILGYLFFRHVVKVVISDFDDWNNIAHFRELWPTVSRYNPTKIFPETLYPLCARIAGYIITPFTKDFIVSLSIMTSLITSAFLTLYIFAFYKFVSLRTHFSQLHSLALSLIFLLLHIVIFGIISDPSETMFYSWDMNCYYHYTIPNLLNGALVLFSITYNLLDTITDKRHRKRSILFIIALYFALFSNLFCNIIFYTYCFSNIIIKLADNNIKVYNIKIKKCIPELCIFCIAICILIFEANGARSSDLTSSITNGLQDRITSALWLISDNYLVGYNHLFTIIAIAVCTYYIINTKKLWKYVLMFIVPYIICNIYYASLCVVSSTLIYINRTDVQFSSLFFLLLLITITIGNITKSHKKLLYATLGVLSIIASQNNYRDKLKNTEEHPYEYWITLNHKIIHEVATACDSNLKDVTISIPRYPNGPNNWPLFPSVGGRISDALYHNGIINYPIIVNTTIE